MKPKVITHLLYSGLGGPGSVFFSLVGADKKNEYSYKTVFCGIEPVRQEYADSCERLAIPYAYIPKIKGLDIKVYIKLYQQFSKFQPSILFLHGVSFILPAIWYRFFRSSRKVIVRDTQAHHLKSKSEWVWLFLCLLFANKLVVLTPEAGQGIKKRFGWFVKRSKIVVITNGLDMEQYQPVVTKNLQKEIKLGMQSRMEPIKDHPTLLKAFKILKDRIPGYSISLHIAGDGVTRPSIEAFIDELGIGDSVNMHGMLNSSDLVHFMQSLDIYVHASFGETLSNSVMQAMACGLPIIASDVAGINNMIKNEETGLLYSSANTEQLAELLESIILDTEKRIELGKRAREYAEKEYSNVTMFNRYKKIF